MTDLESNYDEYENKYRAVLLGLEICNTTQYALIGLFDMGVQPSDRMARINFLNAWEHLYSKGREDTKYWDNIELLLLFLATMSTQDLNAIIESFYWEAWK